MVCSITFKPYDFKAASFTKSPKSDRYIVNCSNYFNCPVSRIVEAHNSTDNATPPPIFKDFDASYHAQYLTRASFVAIYWMLYILNNHNSLQSLMPTHQWRLKSISIPPCERIDDKGKEFIVIFQLYEFEEKISYEIVKYMDRRYGVERYSGHGLDGELD
ncbi:hypothetical protein TWF718_002473 [Orbilia javanica]|uniref:Uncharacterized protein n=1 Tax=Orbilia javanica TaxID=47235 RepID=A0AAN8R8T7_9PEZI